MRKSLLEKMEEAILRPVPYEGLLAVIHREHGMPSSKSETRTTGEKPRDREDFNSLVSVAARKLQPSD
jgi:hypothetical protein